MERKMGDLDLILRAQSGDESAKNSLMIKYKGLVLSICRKYFLLSVEQEDLIQEGMIGLFNALSSFKPNLNASFKTYATRCIKNKIKSDIIRQSRHKNLPLNAYFSVDNQGKILVKDKIDEDSEDAGGFFLESKDLSPEESVIFKENLKEIVNRINIKLSSYEKKVLRLYMSGMRYIDISRILKTRAKSVDNALNRIKIKLRDLKR